MFYIDTSVFVAALTDEEKTPQVQDWLGLHKFGDLCTSEWTISEFSSALSTKMRTGQTDSGERDRALTTFNHLMRASFHLLTISSRHFRAAARFCERFELGLRSGDALHLAVALEQGATIATLDKRFAAAASQVGAPVVIPATH